MSDTGATTLFSPDQCSALILAGGLGKRLRRVVSDCPKPMAPVLGKPFLFWLVKYLRWIGIKRIVVSAGYKAGQIAVFIDELNVKDANIQCVIESEPLGTGGAIHLAKLNSRFEGPCWLVLNGDSIADINLEEALMQLTHDIKGIIFGNYQEDAAKYGTLLINEHRIIHGFHEKRDGKGWVSAGIYLLTSDIIDKFPAGPSSLEKEILPTLIKNGDIFKLCRCRHAFLDIGTPTSYAGAENYMKRYFKDIVCDDHQ